MIVNYNMRKLLLFIFCSYAFMQTNITTPQGSTGFGIWTTINQDFKENKMVGSVILDLHLNFGLEISLGKTLDSTVDYTFNQFGLAYDIKIFEWGSKIFCKRYDVDEFDFVDAYEKEEIGFELYKRGWKLNSFLRYSQDQYNQTGDILVSNNDSKIQYLTIGGVGRMTRFATYGFGIKMPFENLFHMRYSSIEVTFGTSF